MEETISRRLFLKKAAITAGVIGLTGIIGADAGKRALMEPEIEFPRKIITKDDKMIRMLVTYASKCGSTGEIAAVLGEELSKGGFAVDIFPVDEIQTLKPYEFVVLGTALRFEKPLNEMMNFISKYKRDISDKKIAYFSTGVYMRDPSIENQNKTRKMLEPLKVSLPEPVSEAMFAGKVDYKKIAPFWRFLISMDSSGLMREGDWRDWQVIRTWGKQLVEQFSGKTTFYNGSIQ